MAKAIPLGGKRGAGKVAIVDDGDVEKVAAHKWYLDKDGYALTLSAGTTIRMHRLIAKASKGQEVDHIDGSRLNNRRGNLRICTGVENQRNNKARKTIGRTSQYKGVYWHKSVKRWVATIKPNHKTLHLGVFDSEEAAARAYDKAAREMFGEFARLNFPT